MPADDSDSMPPKTLAELTKDLENPNFSSYVYIGNKGDKGWKYALKAQEYIVALRVYRVAPGKAAEFRGEFELASSTVGVVYGYDKEVRVELTAAKTVKGLKLLDLIRDSR